MCKNMQKAKTAYAVNRIFTAYLSYFKYITTMWFCQTFFHKFRLGKSGFYVRVAKLRSPYKKVENFCEKTVQIPKNPV